MLTADEARVCIEQRLGYTVDESSGCWIAEQRAPTGFGPFVAFYEAVHGPVPPGFEVVHRCEGALEGCVRPTHLDPVPAGQRVRPALAVPLAVAQRSAWPVVIAAEREARTMSREDFAAELHVSPSTIKAWETGARAPDQDTALRVAKRLGWGEGTRKWIVTLIVQEVVISTTAGEAVRAARERLEREDRPLKSAVFKVQLAGKRRRPRRKRNAA